MNLDKAKRLEKANFLKKEFLRKRRLEKANFLKKEFIRKKRLEKAKYSRKQFLLKRRIEQIIELDRQVKTNKNTNSRNFTIVSWLK